LVPIQAVIRRLPSLTLRVRTDAIEPEVLFCGITVPTRSVSEGSVPMTATLLTRHVPDGAISGGLGIVSASSSGYSSIADGQHWLYRESLPRLLAEFSRNPLSAQKPTEILIPPIRITQVKGWGWMAGLEAGQQYHLSFSIPNYDMACVGPQTLGGLRLFAERSTATATGMTSGDATSLLK
jgi:hypothetical protein